MASTDVSQRSMGDKKTIFIVGLGMVGIGACMLGALHMRFTND
jgi:hypothetical protein